MRRGLFFVKIKLFLGFANFLYVKTFLTARAMFSFFWKTSFTIIAPENLDKLDSPMMGLLEIQKLGGFGVSLVVKRSLTFLLQRKLPRCGARSSTKERFAESSVRSKVPNLSFLPRNKAASRFSFCGLMPPTLAHPFFLRRKDAKTYQRGGILFEITSGTVKFAKYFEEWNASFILGGNDIKLCFYRI